MAQPCAARALAPASAVPRETLADLWRTPAEVRSRYNFQFSATGRVGAALSVTSAGEGFLERWLLDGPEPRCEATPWPQPADGKLTAADAAAIKAHPFDDGSLVLLRGRGGRTELSFAPPEAPGGGEPVGVIDHPQAVLVPGPGEGRRAVVLSRGRQGEAALWLLSGHPPRLRLLTRTTHPSLAGAAGCGWVSQDVFALTRRVEGKGRVVLAHTSSGELTVLDPVGAGSDDHVLLTAPETGRMLLASNAAGAHALVDAAAAHEGPRRFLDASERLEGVVTPLALDPTGSRALLLSKRGMRSRLHILSLDDDRIRELPVPEGTVSAPGAWVPGADGGRVHCVLASPSAPFEILRLRADGTRSGDAVADGSPASWPGQWADGTVERFPGPDGPVEAMVQGRVGWRDADLVAIALHGGPERSWQLRHDPLLQCLSRAGITVIAPNQRGSVGYGRAHQEAIRGRWGGPDLDDVLCLSRFVRRERGERRDERLLLMGRSYGAFLALLAACAEPQAWSRVAVVAPFLSGARLHEEANAEVRRMLDRLGAREEIDDGLGPRDVLRLAPRLRAPLMVLHGSDDEIVPVSQSRALARRLAELGRGADDLRYVEIPGAGHSAIDGSHDLRARLAAFLAGSAADGPAQSFPQPRIEGGWERDRRGGG